MAVSIDGELAPKEYRHYRIRSVAGADDYASQLEVLRRRLTRGIREDNLPDLIVIDGGKGQLAVLTTALEELGLGTSIAAAALAKSRVERAVRSTRVERSDERVFLPGRLNPVVLRQGSAPLFLLTRLRDEAHRFAITRHRRLRTATTLRSSLADIPGVGPARQRLLLKHFGSLKRLAAAPLEALQTVPGLPAPLAAAIHAHLGAEQAQAENIAKGKNGRD
jgi:excinuclease ABC subunit C